MRASFGVTRKVASKIALPSGTFREFADLRNAQLTEQSWPTSPSSSASLQRNAGGREDYFALI